MLMQTQAALRQLDVDAPAAREALGSVVVTGQRAMVDLDDALAVLAGESTRQRAGAGLADLADLVRRVRPTGTAVELRVPDALPADHPAGGVAYRVVREACTNAVRHSPGAAITVAVALDGDHLEVDVRNGPAVIPTTPPAPGVAVSPTRGGRGLTGLAEQVRADGGHLDAGPSADGGWRVRVDFPGRS